MIHSVLVVSVAYAAFWYASANENRVPDGGAMSQQLEVPKKSIRDALLGADPGSLDDSVRRRLIPRKIRLE